MFIVLALLFGQSVAQRPSNTSTCDYYAQQYYGANNAQTQLQLVQDIVALAFGGKSNSSNATSDITGILNPGIFQDQVVDLQPWFNGSIPSTNLNNQPVGIDWLDGGGLDPLHDYLSGASLNYSFTPGSNQNRLFINFLAGFSNAFGCSLPPSPPASSAGGGRLNLAYVHKYMNLNYTDLGYFIDQLSRSTTHFGFSEIDSQTLGTGFNSLFNVRCAPAITTDPSEGPQLLSLCQASNCPLAEPNPNCSAYVDLPANPVVSGGATTAFFTATASSSPSITGLTVNSTTPTPKAKVGAGVIAGATIGGVAGVLCMVGVVVFWLRRRKSGVESAPPYTTAPTYEYVYTAQPATQQMSKKSVPELESPTNPQSSPRTNPHISPPISHLASSPTSPSMSPTHNYQNLAEMAGR